MKLLKIILINLLVVFVLLEGGMRVYYGVTDKTPPDSDHSLYREWRWVQQRLADGKVAFDSRFVHDSFAGWKSAPNLNTADAYGASIRTNSQNMRNDGDFSLAPNGKPRLMIVGDSYSFGHGVSNDDTYAYILNKDYMPSWEVMNLAVSATGTDQSYIMYERYGEKFSPNIVLLGFYLLDFNRNTFYFRDYAKPMYVPRQDGSLELTHSPVIAPDKLIAQYKHGEKKIGGWGYSYAYAAFARVITDYFKRNRSPGSLPRRTLTGIMEKFVTRVRANGATPVWVVFPVHEITKKAESKYDVVEDFAVAEAKRLGMPVMSLEPVFREHIASHPEIDLWRPKEIGGHLSAAGNQLAAKAIYEFLQAEKLLATTAVVAQP
jgi:hypothetical protein